MSDLQCPAQVIVLTPERAGDPEALRAAVGGLAGARLVRVYAGTELAAYAQQVALALDLPVAAGEDLDEIADQHAGEAVVVLRAWTEPGPVVMERDAAGWHRIS